jgi:hypothetical protein
MEDSMPKGVEGYVVPPWVWGGGRLNQLMLQAEGESLERWKGAGRLWREPS